MNQAFIHCLLEGYIIQESKSFMYFISILYFVLVAVLSNDNFIICLKSYQSSTPSFLYYVFWTFQVHFTGIWSRQKIVTYQTPEVNVPVSTQLAMTWSSDLRSYPLSPPLLVFAEGSFWPKSCCEGSYSQLDKWPYYLRDIRVCKHVYCMARITGTNLLILNNQCVSCHSLVM